MRMPASLKRSQIVNRIWSRVFNPLRWSMSTQRIGGTVVVLDHFDPDVVLDAIAQHRVTHAQFVPTHFVRLLTWVPGVPLALVKPHSEALLVSLGRAVGEMDRAFEGFEHPAMHRPFPWDLTRTVETTAHVPGTSSTLSTTRQHILSRILSRFREVVQPALPGLRRHVIHEFGTKLAIRSPIVEFVPAPYAAK